MSLKSKNSGNFELISEPLILENILIKRLPSSCNVYNMMRSHKQWDGELIWLTFYDSSADDVWIIAIFFRKDHGQIIAVSRPPTAQITPEVKNAFSSCNFIDWNDKFNFTALDPITSTMVIDISIMDNGNCTEIYPVYLYIQNEDAAKLNIQETARGFEGLKPINNKKGEEFLIKTWKYSNDDTGEYLQKCLERNLSAGVYVNGEIVSGGIVNADGLIGMLFTLREFRGRGYGKMVMSHLMKEIIDRKQIPCCCVEVKNKVSNDFQLKIGFEEVGQYNDISYFKTEF